MVEVYGVAVLAVFYGVLAVWLTPWRPWRPTWSARRSVQEKILQDINRKG